MSYYIDDAGLDGWDVLDDLAGEEPTDTGDTDYEDAECIRETEKAVLIRLDGNAAERWLPKKGLRGSSDVRGMGDTGTLRIHDWAAKMWAEESALQREVKATQKDVHIEGVVALQSTAKAVLISFSDGREMWMPRTHIREASEVKEDPDSGTLVIAEWMAKQKGLVK